MSTYRELVYLVLDELKGMSDDFDYTEDHVAFLLDKYRAFLLKQKYSDVKKPMPEGNYQTVCLDLIQVPAISGEICEGGSYLRSTNKLPFLIKIGNPRVYAHDYYQGEITYVSRDRMRYVGYNKYLQNIIYASIGPDNYLYLKSSNPQYLYLEKVEFTGIFQSPSKATELQCDLENSNCDKLDNEFPIEEALVPPMVELVVKELSGVIYRPKDEKNNAKDDLANKMVEKQ